MNKPCFGGLVCLATLLLVGCIEESVVVKVNRDGSGVVHVRSYHQKANLGFSIGSSKQETSSEKVPNEGLPTEEKLQALAERLGTGVRVESVAAATNPQGWNGFEVVFAFDDVNELVLSDQLFTLGHKTKKDAEDAEGTEPNSSKTGPHEKFSLVEGTRFQLQGDRLLISRDSDHQLQANANQQPREATKDPFAEAPKSPGVVSITGPQMEKFMSQVLKDARMGLFVELESGIGETNARYHNEDQVTLFKIEIGPLLEQKPLVDKLSRLSHRYHGPELRSETQKLADQIKGLDIDIEDQISIQFAN
ncbi:hypothetical protein [Novipirellula rosea]|uniref:hypothetical protein n=1 Tax=Novipirellula rosea TaxID=1031540 RepID=UPI0031E732C5